MQATRPFNEFILQCDQEFSFERVSGFFYHESTTFSKIKLSGDGGGGGEVSVSANANSPLSVVSTLGNPAPKIF